MSNKEIPVCLDLHTLPNGQTLVAGILAVGDDGKPARFCGIDDAAIFFATTGLIPTKIPDEEGWEQTHDLPPQVLEELLNAIANKLSAKE